jgi:hypothetical protein|tara:strand:- start:237 stop:389 length:153 start_codon:yes stop_codon:yes gene_type:complete
MWVAVYVLALLVLVACSVLFGYVWCLRVEHQAQEEARFWQRVLREWERHG